jgi:hypothetical protein
MNNLPPGVTNAMIEEQAGDGDECPDHEDGHIFIPCDDLPATCTCGRQEYE